MKVSETYPDHTGGVSGSSTYGIVAFSPDAAGRVQLKTDQNGDTVTFVFDLAGRMTQRDYRLKANSPSGTIADSDTFTFDKSSRMLTGISGRYTNTVTMTYAANDGRLQNESLTIGGQTYLVGRTYDTRGKIFQMTYPNGAVVERAYTNRGQLNTVKYKDTAGGTLNTEDTRTYDLGGRLSTSVYRNGVTTTNAYRSSGSQKDNLLASISFAHPAGVTSDDDKIGAHNYAWDANKNKSSETITGAATAYINFGFTTAGGSDPDGYDDEDRLVYFKRAGTTNPQSWNLSLVGDWNSYSDFGTNQNRTHGPAHEILTAGATPNNVVLHDVKGNITDIPTNVSSPARKLFWDFDNHLKGVDNTGDSVADVSYEFDALGRRVARTEGSTAVVHIPAAQQVIADYTRGTAASVTPLYRYIYGDYIDEPILRQTTSTTLLYYHHNQQYSTVALTTSTGFVTERYAYSAYGVLSVLINTGTVRPWTDTSNRYTYTGREWDDTAKMFHFRTRWYEPQLGRFIGRDLLRYLGGFNTYRYVRNNPTRFVDPLGLVECDKDNVGARIAELGDTVFSPGDNNPDEIDMMLDCACVLLFFYDAVPVKDINDLFLKLHRDCPWGADVVLKLTEMRDFHKLVKACGDQASVWTKVQCKECKCTTWFTGFPFYREPSHFVWVNSGKEKWVQCDLSKTAWGKREQKRDSVLWVDGKVLWFGALDKKRIEQIEAQCAEQAKKSCEVEE